MMHPVIQCISVSLFCVIISYTPLFSKQYRYKHIACLRIIKDATDFRISKPARFLLTISCVSPYKWNYLGPKRFMDLGKHPEFSSLNILLSSSGTE